MKHQPDYCRIVVVVVVLLFAVVVVVIVLLFAVVVVVVLLFAGVVVVGKVEKQIFPFIINSQQLLQINSTMCPLKFLNLNYTVAKEMHFKRLLPK